MRHHRLVLTRHNKLVTIYEDGGLMPSPNEKLAESLDVLKAIQEGNQRVFRSDDLSRVHRERLVDNGFLQEVMKGWLISSSPDAQAGEGTPWHASFWEFCARYCDERFGDQWHLSPEQSLFLHGERTVIPDQLVVHSPKATNNDIKLLFGTTLYDLKVAEMPPPAALTRSEEHTSELQSRLHLVCRLLL